MESNELLLRCAAAWTKKLMLCYRRYAAMPLGNSLKANAFKMVFSNIDLNGFADIYSASSSFEHEK
jgi:hypothetical protein